MQEQVPRNIKTTLPSSLVLSKEDGRYLIQSKKSVPWASGKRASAIELVALTQLQAELRFDVHYINGAEALWYVRLNGSGPKRLRRRSPTLILVAMHRLSEISRYKPLQLESYLRGRGNWLLSEFIDMSAVQFLDEIAAEITGHQFFIPNVRSPM